MKPLIMLTCALLLSLFATAQQYIGTMTIGKYTQEKVIVDISPAPSGHATLTMNQVKFARMMPVKLDVVISPIETKEGHLQADNVVPTAKGKRYEKYTVRRLRGAASAQHLDFRCQMGKKELVFNGKIATR